MAVRRPPEPASTCAPPTSPYARRAVPPRTTRSAPSWPRSSNVERSRARSSSGATSTAAARAPPSAPGPGPTAPPTRPRDSSASTETARSARPRRRSCRPPTPTTTSCWSARISPCGRRPRTMVVSGSEGNQRARPSVRNVPFPRKPPDLLMAEQPAIAGCPRLPRRRPRGPARSSADPVRRRISRAARHRPLGRPARASGRSRRCSARPPSARCSPRARRGPGRRGP